MSEKVEMKQLEDGSEGDNPLNFLMDCVGADGKFQSRFNYTYNMGFMMINGMSALTLILALTSQEHWCHVPGRSDTNLTLTQWKELTVPRVQQEEDEASFSKCNMFNFSLPLDISYLEKGWNESHAEIVPCQHGWDYDTTWYTQTVTSQEDWVCDKELYVPNTLLFAKVGEVLGEMFIGQMGDAIGRRPVMFLGVLLLVLGRCVAVFSAGIYTLFLAANVVSSLPAGVIFQSPLIIGMEISSVQKRAHIALLQCVGWTAGICLTPMVAWATGGRWKVFTILSSVPCALIFLAYKSFPESPRWYISRGRTKECLRMLQRIAIENGTALPENAAELLKKLEGKKETVYGAASFLSNRRLFRNTVLMCSCLALVLVMNFTIILCVASMSGNPFLNMFLQSLVEFPGFLAGRFICDRFGRRWSQAGAYCVAAVLLFICTLTVAEQHLTQLLIVLILFIKFCFTVGAYCAYLQCMEIYPTCLRQTGTSLGVLLATSISTVGPYIVYLGATVDVRYPYAILVLMCFLAMICGTLLPETLNQKLPDTIEDSSHFGEDQKYWSFPKRKTETYHRSSNG
ncbi:carcinine transporter-like [Periplaneta americana]|uniref:carcinine transporter-like n=1 Tax=Periplaneta americana TaxID=6978 RepID=UPI0037E9750A